MSDPFSSAWIYILLFVASIGHGWRVARACLVSGIVSYATAFALRAVGADLSPSFSRFPSISVSLIAALGFWVILGKRSSSVTRILSFLLLVGTVATNRLWTGGHGPPDVAGGIAAAALGIAVGKRIIFRWPERRVTCIELPQQWPDRIYVPPGGNYTWSRSEVAERYPYPLTPLASDLFVPAVGRSVQKMARTLGIKKKGIIGYSIRRGYVYSNMGPAFLRIPAVLRRFLSMRKAFLRYALDEYPAARSSFWEEHQKLSDRLSSLEKGPSVPEMYLTLSDSLTLFESWMLQQNISLFYVTFGFFYLKLVLRLHFLRKYNEVQRALPLGLPTVSGNERILLFRLGRLIGDRAIVWEDLDGEAKMIAEQLLASFGDQASSYDFTESTWRETPDRILELARSAAEAMESPEEQMERLSAERRQAELRLTRRLRRLYPFSGGRLADELILLTHSLYPLKEERQKQMTAAWALVRRAALALGGSLKATEILRSPEHVHFLTATELSAIVHRQVLGNALRIAPRSQEDVAAVVRARQNDLRLSRTLDVPDPGPAAVLELPWRKPRLGAHGLVAKYGSAGQVVGPAVIIRGHNEFHKMKPGLILVAPMTSPQWDILFPGALGVVVESGGPTSHAMLKASEYDLPVVIGLPGITKRVKDGDMLRLDADRKLLTLENKNA